MATNTTDLDSKTFNKFIKEGDCVVDFWAEWCGPCKIMGPIFEEGAKEFKGKVRFGKVDVDKNNELAQRFGVMSIPTTIFFKKGEQIDRFSGAVSKSALIKMIKEAF
ncbi:MAG: thioredoxin [Nanoarchaeota archaeon]